MEVLSPRSLDEALRLAAEHPAAMPIAGGTDLMVELNFDRRRPEVILNLAEVPELRGWSRDDGLLRLGAGLTYTELMEEPLCALVPALAEAARTVGSPQIRNRGTIGGNLGTASPAGDALPPLLVEDAEVDVLRGAERQLSNRPKLIIELHSLKNHEPVRLILGRAGYEKIQRFPMPGPEWLVTLVAE